MQLQRGAQCGADPTSAVSVRVKSEDGQLDNPKPPKPRPFSFGTKQRVPFGFALFVSLLPHVCLYFTKPMAGKKCPRVQNLTTEICGLQEKSLGGVHSICLAGLYINNL